jgi:tetratricopeptide (TPR) repeat protein
MSQREQSDSPSKARYAIEEEIGRGGMGIVFKVYDRELRRTLAMKVLRAESTPGSSDATPLARFLEEAQVTAQLDHPGIVPVHEMGRDEQDRLRKAVEQMMRVLGADSTDTISTKNKLGRFCQTLGKVDEAEQIYQETADTATRVLGESHPLTATVTYNLGSLYEVRGLTDEAEDCYRRALPIARRTLGTRHNDTLTMIHALAGLLHRTGRDDEAEPLLRELLENSNKGSIGYEDGEKMLAEIKAALGAQKDH